MATQKSIFSFSTIIKSDCGNLYASLTVYSNILHIIVTCNGKPGVCVQYIPHSKMGNDSTQQYTIHELLGQTTIQHELLLKQIASSVVISENAIPFLCNLMIPQDLDRVHLLAITQQLRNFIDSHAESILQGYIRFM